MVPFSNQPLVHNQLLLSWRSSGKTQGRVWQPKSRCWMSSERKVSKRTQQFLWFRTNLVVSRDSLNIFNIARLAPPLVWTVVLVIGTTSGWVLCHIGTKRHYKFIGNLCSASDDHFFSMQKLLLNTMTSFLSVPCMQWIQSGWYQSLLLSEHFPRKLVMLLWTQGTCQ